MRYAVWPEIRKTPLVTIQRLFRALGLAVLIAPSSLPSAYPIQGTFLNFYRNLTPELWALEFQSMKSADINTIVIVSVGHLQASATQALSCSVGASGSYTDSSGYGLAGDGLLYPSDFVSPAQRPTADLLEMVLELADSAGMNVYLSSLQTATDWMDGTEFCALREYNQQVATEIVQRYGHHSSFKGWYFTQEVWMNWVKYYGQQHGAGATGYYGTNLMAEWVNDMKAIDATKLTSAAVVVKESGTGAMPGLTAGELQQWTASFLQTAKLDILMPQDGAGAQAGAPLLSDLPVYFAAMSAAIPAAGAHTALWSTLELFTASSDPKVSGEQYRPTNDTSRIQTQVNAVRPFVSGYVSWMFGDDMSPQATYYPVEADELNRQYKYTFKPEEAPNDDVLLLQSYSYPSQQPDARYPDSSAVPMLSDGTGGGYNGNSLTSWVGFSNPNFRPATVQIVGDLGTIQTIHSVRVLAQSWVNTGILHPSRMVAEASQDGVNWTAFGMSTSFPSDTQNFAVVWGEVDGSASARFVRWTFTYSEWLMLAELEVVGSK